MMQIFRKHAKGPVFKGLMILLALTFVVWGVGDVIRSGNKRVAFKVGNNETSLDEFQKMLGMQIAQIESDMGRKLEQNEVELLGIKQVVLNQLINKKLLLEEAKNISLLISDDMVKYEIATMQSFYKDGKFDKDTFTRYLRNTGLSEDQFIAALKEDMAVQNIILSLTLNKEAPKILVDALLKARSQTKVVNLYRIDAASIGAINTPSDEELKASYEELKEGFKTEEERDFLYAKFSIEDIKDDVKISEEDLKDAYEAKKLLFSQQEKRSIRQLLFKDEQHAIKASNELLSGKSFDEVAKDKTLESNKVDVESAITRDTFDQEISNAIFSTPKGAATKVVKSPLGYHIFYVKDVIESKTQSFEEVKGQLLEQLKEEHKFELLSKMAQDVEDDVLHGLKLQEIATKYSLKIDEMKGVTKGAIGSEGSKFGHFKQVFTQDINVVSSLTPMEGHSYFITEVTNTKPAETLPYEAVKDKVQKFWVDKTKNKLLFQKAADVQKSLKDGSKVDMKHDSIELNWFEAQKSALPGMIKDEILKLNKNEFSQPVKDQKTGDFIIAQIVDVKNIDSTNDEEKRKMVEYEFTANATNELMMQYFNELRKKYDIKIIDIDNS